MSRTPKRTNWTAARARRELEAWRQSGESMAAFARKHGYQPKRLEYWRRLESEAQPPERATTGLAPAVITGLNRPPMVVTVTSDGVRLEIDDPSAVHAAWLAALAAALRDGAAA